MDHAGVYIHIPFCRARCSYCDFATGMYETAAADRYVRAVIKEISSWDEVENAKTVNTIYFGGGTPSLLSLGQLEELLCAIHKRFNVDEGAEVTLEINPGDGGDNPRSRREGMRGWQQMGINRASFGAQTFDDRELKLLGRTHDSRDISATFEDLRKAGFRNINFDLIAALPGQTLNGWKRNLEAALKLWPEHLSLYLLDVHEDTPLADQISRGQRPKPDDDLAAEMYLMMIDEVCGAGYLHYEISNFCLPGFEARHNTKYWTGAPYYGFGCSAHSYDGRHLRWANERDTARYLESIDNRRSPIIERTELDEADSRSEAMFLGLRLMRGLELESYRLRFGRDLREEYGEALANLSEAGLIRLDEGLLRLTTRGALLSNEVFAALA